jgi:hypothetical protein
MSRSIKVLLVMVLAVGALSLRVWAGEKHDMSKRLEKKMPAEFEKMKSLVGTWTGKAKMHGDKEEKVKIVYKLTAGGSAILELFNPGTSHEMATIYNVENGQVCMTHYCALGNAPKMRFKGMTDNSISFEMKGKDGISSDKEMHMHALTIIWKDKNHISAEWTSYTDGKAQPAHAFNLSRKK